ncbi:MAG: hypothetical protein Fur0032_18850 [Terrimicrobiaceae bacterium]
MRVVVAIVCGMAASASVAVGLGTLGGLDPLKAAIALAVGLAVAGLAVQRVLREPVATPGLWDVVLLAAWGVASFRAFFWLLYPQGDEWRILSPHNLGDLSLHIGLIRYLASGIDFWPPSQILAGELLTYPVGPDLFNSLLLLVGVDLRTGLIVVGFTLSLCGGYALWRFAGPLGVAAVLVGGGMAGFAIFRGVPFQEFGADSTWKNAFLTMVVPQRGFLYSLPAGVALLWAWHSEFFGGRRLIPLALQVLLYATLPLFQLHSFLALSLVLASAWLMRPSRAPLVLAGLAFLPATVFVLLVTAKFSAGGRLRFEPLWALGEGNALSFLVEFGAAFVVAGASLLAAFRSARKDAQWLTASGLALALIGFLFPLTDWAWDNTKLLIWAWILPMPAIRDLVIRPQPLPARAAICAVLFFTGSLALLAGLDTRHGYTLARRSELADWQRLLSPLPPDAVIACSPDYNHPALLLGRRVVCGYEGHLASHGLDYRQTMGDLRRVLALEPGWQGLARKLGANAVAIGNASRPVLLSVPNKAAIGARDIPKTPSSSGNGQ